MIKISIHNCASALPILAAAWIKKSNSPATVTNWYDDEEYVNALWMNTFGIHGHSYRKDDDDYWDDYYSHQTSLADSDDDEDDYHQYFEKPSNAVLTGIWDDDDEWKVVAGKYDSYEKSNNAINEILRSSTYNSKPVVKERQSKVFQDIQKNKKKEEDNWRREILEETIDEDRKIFFYDNPRDENSKQEFITIDEFLMFCEDNDIEVDEVSKSDIEFYTQCHCGLDEYAASNGRKELRCSRSYGELMYDLYGSDLFNDDVPIYSTDDDMPF